MGLNNKISITKEDLTLEFPEPGKPLLEGPGEPCTWEQCMKDTALQAEYYLREFDEAPPALPEERFVLD